MTTQDSSDSNSAEQVAALQQQCLTMQEQCLTMQETVMHLQHDQQQMHEVLLAQQEEIGRLNAMLAQVNGNMERLLAGEEMPTPEDDKPPHY
jgi:hypothetical protein